MTRHCERPACAGPAVVDVLGRIGLEFDVDDDRAVERETAESSVDDQGIFADPAEPGQPCEVAFEERGGVGDGTAVGARAFGAERRAVDPVRIRLEDVPCSLARPPDWLDLSPL